jgi:hypothetical protein
MRKLLCAAGDEDSAKHAHGVIKEQMYNFPFPEA